MRKKTSSIAKEMWDSKRVGPPYDYNLFLEKKLPKINPKQFTSRFKCRVKPRDYDIISSVEIKI